MSKKSKSSYDSRKRFRAQFGPFLKIEYRMVYMGTDEDGYIYVMGENEFTGMKTFKFSECDFIRDCE